MRLKIVKIVPQCPEKNVHEQTCDVIHTHMYSELVEDSEGTNFCISTY